LEFPVPVYWGLGRAVDLYCSAMDAQYGGGVFEMGYGAPVEVFDGGLREIDVVVSCDDDFMAMV
jgi:hypothetical protein